MSELKIGPAGPLPRERSLQELRKRLADAERVRDALYEADLGGADGRVLNFLGKVITKRRNKLSEKEAALAWP